MKRCALLLSLFFALTIAGASIALAQSPGDTVGWTQIDYQCNGSTGQRIAVDSAGNVHFTWTAGSPATNRVVFYNYLNTNGFMLPGAGESISDSWCGYSQIAVTIDGRAVVVFHRGVPAGSESLFCAIDMAPGLGYFEYHHPPNLLSGTRLMWPYLTVDRNNRIQLIATGNTSGARPFGYMRSNNGGTTWTPIQIVDTVQTISPIIVSSPVSDKVAIVYCHPTDTTQLRNDIYFIQATDGITWDFRNGKINVTNYGQGGDSLFAYSDVDAAYDYNDNLHIVWNAQYLNGSAGSQRVFLYHYDWQAGAITEITHVDVPHLNRCQFGGWNLALNKMSIAAEQFLNRLYVVYCRFDTSDCASDSTANGEIYFQKSTDGGDTWTYPLDLTNSHTPGCNGPNCASDLFPSVAEHIDTAVHVFYVCSRYPNIIFPNVSSPMLYLPIHVDPLIGANDDPLPASFILSQNYPNPFNAQTTIKYGLVEKSQITLSIYNIIGQKVTTLVDGTQEAGEHQAIWNASASPSGIYFARLEMAGRSQSVRMVLLK